MPSHAGISTISLLLVLACSISLAQESTSPEDAASYVREAYRRITDGEVTDLDECTKLIDASKKHITHLADSDPEGLIALTREIALDSPRLLESEKYRGMAPPRLQIKSYLMGAVVVVGGENARSLLEELAQMVESGEAEKQALGANPADLLEVPVKFDRVIADTLEGNSQDPKPDLRNAVRFAQEHFVAQILLAQDVPGLSAAELLNVKDLAVNRLLEFFRRGRPDKPLAALVYDSAAAVLDRARLLGVPLPESADKLLISSQGKGGSLPLKKLDIGKGQPTGKSATRPEPAAVNNTPHVISPPAGLPSGNSEQSTTPVEATEIEDSTHMLLWLGIGVPVALAALLSALLRHCRRRRQTPA